MYFITGFFFNFYYFFQQGAEPQRWFCLPPKPFSNEFYHFRKISKYSQYSVSCHLSKLLLIHVHFPAIMSATYRMSIFCNTKKKIK